MATLLEIGLDGGGSVLVEVDDRSGGPALRGAASPGAAVVETGQSLDRVLGEVGSLAHAMVRKLRALSDSPHEIEVEFSVKLTAEAKVVIARASGEANFRIAMRWSPQSAQDA